MPRSVMNMKVLLSCLLLVVFSQDCLGADIPVYCRVLKINCSKVTRHPCCTETKKEVVEQEQTSPEPTTQQNKDYLEDTYDEYEGGETEEDDTEKDVSDLVTNNQENDEESFSEPDLSFPDTSKEVLSAQPSQIIETVVEPEPNQLSVSTEKPKQFAPKFCLVLRFNCGTRKTHPCCKFPLPEDENRKSGEVDQEPEASTPRSTPVVRPSPSPPSPTQQIRQSTRERPPFFRPRRPAPLPTQPPRASSAETTETAPVKEASAEKFNFRSTRPSILRPRGPPTVSTTTTTTEKPTTSSRLFKRPDSRPATSFIPRPSVSSSNGIRSGLCSRLRVNCKRVTKHICCNESEKEADPEENVEEENSAEKKEEVLTDRSDDETSTIADEATAAPETEVFEENSNEKLNAVSSSMEKLSEQGFEAVVSKVSSVSSTETRVVQTVLPPSADKPQNNVQTVNPETAEIEENVEAEISQTIEVESPQSADYYNEEIVESVQTVNEETADDVESVQAVNPQYIETAEVVYPESADFVQTVNPQSDDYYQETANLDSSLNEILADKAADEYPETVKPVYEYPEQEYETIIVDGFDVGTAQPSQPIRIQEPVELRTPATEFPLEEVVEEFIPSIEESGNVYEDESRVFYADEGTGDNENYYYVYEDELESTPQSDFDQSFVSTITAAGVLDPNQIAPRVSTECFRFDCLSRPDHQCCAKKNTKKRQTSLYEFALLPVQKLSSLSNNRDE